MKMTADATSSVYGEIWNIYMFLSELYLYIRQVKNHLQRYRVDGVLSGNGP
jgi:hypothetical protein